MKMNPKILDAELESFAHRKGFESIAQLNAMVAKIDLEQPLIMMEFVEWRENDGSKTGLERILGLQK